MNDTYVVTSRERKLMSKLATSISCLLYKICPIVELVSRASKNCSHRRRWCHMRRSSIQVDVSCQEVYFNIQFRLFSHFFISLLVSMLSGINIILIK